MIYKSWMETLVGRRRLSSNHTNHQHIMCWIEAVWCGGEQYTYIVTQKYKLGKCRYILIMSYIVCVWEWYFGGVWVWCRKKNCAIKKTTLCVFNFPIQQKKKCGAGKKIALSKKQHCVCSIFQFNRKKRHNSSVLLYLPSLVQGSTVCK